MTFTTDPYILEAIKELERLSADEKERDAYEARWKAIMDYRSNMDGSYLRGHAEGGK